MFAITQGITDVYFIGGSANTSYGLNDVVIQGGGANTVATETIDGGNSVVVSVFGSNITINNNSNNTGASATGDRIANGSYSLVIDSSGILTLPTGGHIGPTKGGTSFDAGNGYNASLTTYYSDGNYAACVTGSAGDGTLYITTYADGGPDPSKIWTFSNNGVLTLPEHGKIIFNASNPEQYIEGTMGFHIHASDDVIIDVGADSWSFGTDGALTIPGTIKTEVATGNVVISSSNGTSNFYWSFDNTGRTTIPTGVSYPGTARGAVGDKAGMITIAGAYLYYCYADYTDGSVPIWQKVSMDNTDWD